MVVHTQCKQHRKYFAFKPVKIVLEKKLNSDLLPQFFIELYLHKTQLHLKRNICKYLLFMKYQLQLHLKIEKSGQVSVSYTDGSKHCRIIANGFKFAYTVDFFAMCNFFQWVSTTIFSFVFVPQNAMFHIWHAGKMYSQFLRRSKYEINSSSLLVFIGKS